MEHNICSLIAIIVACCCYVLMVIMNSLAASHPAGQKIFLNSTAGVSEYWFTDLIPNGWTFAILPFIYIWVGLFLVYGIMTIFRKGSKGYLYVTPGHQPSSIYWIMSLNLCCNFTWLILMDRFYPQYALLFDVLLPTTAITALVLSYVALHSHTEQLLADELTKDVWYTRMMTQNGLASYAMWLVTSFILNLDVVIIYFGNKEIQYGGTICTSILLVITFIFLFLDVWKFENYTRYTFASYIVLLVVVVGIAVNNWDKQSSNTVLVAVLLIVVVFGCIWKGLTMSRMHKMYPMGASQERIPLLGSEAKA